MYEREMIWQEDGNLPRPYGAAFCDLRELCTGKTATLALNRVKRKVAEY